jgi:YbbR domain-containing protein
MKKASLENVPGSVLQWLKNFMTENRGLKLISLALAVLFFAISRQPVSETTLTNVPLEIRGLGSGLEISNEAAQTVSVRLRGPNNIIRATMSSQITVVADLSGKESGERVVQLKTKDVTAPDEIAVLRIEPPSVRLKIEPTISRTIPVVAQYSGDPAAGYEQRSFVAEPSVIEISGPQSHVTTINRAFTETIRLDDRRETFRTSVDLDITDRFIRVNTPGTITVTVMIAEKGKP